MLTRTTGTGLGTSFAYFYWYGTYMKTQPVGGHNLMSAHRTDAQTGYHIPAVRTRDRFYAKLENERAEASGA